MILDWIICGLIIWGFASVLNHTIFKKNPVSKEVAWSLTIVIFFVSFSVLRVATIIRYERISEEVGLSLTSNNYGSALTGALLVSFLFYRFLSRVHKKIKLTDGGINQNTNDLLPSQPDDPFLMQDGQSKAQTTHHSSIEIPVNQEYIYENIANEIESGNVEKGLWTRLFAECDGDENATKVHYIKQRSTALIAEEQSRLERKAKERAKIEVAHLEELRVKTDIADPRLIAAVRNGSWFVSAI